MDINLDVPSWIEAARQFFQPSHTVEVVVQAPKEKLLLLGDALSCAMFASFSGEFGAESGITIRLLSSIEKTPNTHPALK